MNLVTQCDLYVVSVQATHPPTGRVTPGSPPGPVGTRPRAIGQVFGGRGARASGTPETGVVAARRGPHLLSSHAAPGGTSVPEESARWRTTRRSESRSRTCARATTAGSRSAFPPPRVPPPSPPPRPAPHHARPDRSQRLRQVHPAAPGDRPDRARPGADRDRRIDHDAGLPPRPAALHARRERGR